MSGSEDRNEDANGSSKNKGGESQGKGVSNKRIGQIVTVVAGICVSAFGLWPDHKFLALALPVPLFFGMMLHDGAQPMRVSAVFTGILALILTIVYLKLPAPPPQIGWLQAAGLPTPPNGCDGHPGHPDDLLMLFGDNAVRSPSQESLEALKVGECSPLLIRKTPLGASISTDIYDPTGVKIGTIVDNKFSFPPLDGLSIQQSPRP